MKRQRNEVRDGNYAAAVGIWENEDGATGRDPMEHQDGRSVEADRSWMIYHVFTGVPANAEGQAMTGLSQADSSGGMLFLNLCNAARRKELSCPEDNAGATRAAQP